jgi:hypothetical protein
MQQYLNTYFAKIQDLRASFEDDPVEKVLASNQGTATFSVWRHWMFTRAIRASKSGRKLLVPDCVKQLHSFKHLITLRFARDIVSFEGFTNSHNRLTTENIVVLLGHLLLGKPSILVFLARIFLLYLHNPGRPICTRTCSSEWSWTFTSCLTSRAEHALCSLVHQNSSALILRQAGERQLAVAITQYVSVTTSLKSEHLITFWSGKFSFLRTAKSSRLWRISCSLLLKLSVPVTVLSELSSQKSIPRL